MHTETDWMKSPFTGLFSGFTHLKRKPYEPDVHVAGARLVPGGSRFEEIYVGAAGWTREQAENGCIGEGLSAT